MVSFVFAGELLRSLLDPLEHLALHDERAGLHRDHAELVLQRREPEAVAADQPRLPVLFLEDERPGPVAVGGADREHVFGLHDRVAHPVGGEAEAVSDLGALELGHDQVAAVHVQAEQVLDPVVGVGAATRGRAHLRDPRPDGRRGRFDRDRAR